MLDRTLTWLAWAAVILVVVGTAVTGCTPAPALPLDKSGDELRITVTYHDTLDSLQQTYALASQVHGSDNYYDANGFSLWSEDGDWCDIHALRVRTGIDTSRMNVLGHELTHCLHGRFHD